LKSASEKLKRSARDAIAAKELDNAGAL